MLVAAIERRSPDDTPGEALGRMVRDYAAHRRPLVPERKPEELSANARLVFTTPALQAKALYLLLEAQQRIGRTQDELWEASRRGLDVALHGLLSVGRAV